MGAYYRIEIDGSLPIAKRRRALKKACEARQDTFSRLYRSQEAAREAVAQLPDPSLYVVRPSGTYFVGRR